MANFINRLRPSRQKRSKGPMSNARTRPGDGVGYPVPYDGNRNKIDHEFLKRCKTLAPYSGAYRMNETTVIKTGEAVRMAEAAAMRLVAEKTSVPVPKVLDAYIQESDGRGVIVMEYVQGETLEKAWSNCSPAQKQALIAQLKRFVAELNLVKGVKIGAVDGAACSDQFFSDDNTKCGPFSTEQEFHQALAQALPDRGNIAWRQMVARFLASLKGHDIVLTHGDLTPRNILVRDGVVVAILDWELSGFYPDYWEYVKTHLWEDWTSDWIAARVPDQIMTAKLVELSHLLHARDIVWS